MNYSKTVLVVDDNATNIEVLQEILEGNYRVLAAYNGKDALRIAEQRVPRVVLLDVMLPSMDGYEICRRLRLLPGMESARIIMVSAKAMPSEQQAGFAAGADAYVTKPFDDSELLAAIHGYEDAQDELVRQED